jgi:sugar O-acyltransferase (sialic acid O-acetyltransferase NeuD family)
MKKALIGYGGHAREVMCQMNTTLPCFVDDEYVVNGTLPLSMFDPYEYEVMVTIANSKDRYEVTKRLPKVTKYFSWIHPTALIMDNNIEIGDGSFIGANTILTTNIKLGSHTILNRGVQIGHDCIIGNFFSAMPGVIISGNVTINDFVYMGNNSSIREKIQITKSVIIGMNSAVVKNIENSGVYVGIPSKKIMNII